MKEQLRQGLAGLPAPKNDYEIVLPEDENQDMEESMEQEEFVEDQADIDDRAESDRAAKRESQALGTEFVEVLHTNTHPLVTVGNWKHWYDGMQFTLRFNHVPSNNNNVFISVHRNWLSSWQGTKFRCCPQGTSKILPAIKLISII